MTRRPATRRQDTAAVGVGHSRSRRHLAMTGSALLAVSIGVSACGSARAPSQTGPVGTQSSAPQVASPSTQDEVPASLGDDVVRADQAFWADYANGDAEGACSRALGYAHGQVVAMGGVFLAECVSSFGAYSPAGTSLTIGRPVVYGDAIALVTSSGRACGAESLTVGSCSTIPDLSEEMPVSASKDDFGAALSGIVTGWSETTGGWSPDVLVKVDGQWHPLLPIADPVAVKPDPPLDGVDPPSAPDNQPTRPWTDQDWNDTCASGGCGAVPGLPPFVPGGGLSLGGG